MAMMRFEARNGLRVGVIGLAAVVAVLTITSDAADARHHRRLRVHYVSAHHVARVHHAARAEDYSPPSASIMVDGNTGAVLQASNPDAPRHPASLTKIMTLYLLFERLDAGKIKLDTPLKVSEHAADQDPTKLDLKAGQTIPVEDAIKGVVTRSANDAAVVIAESLGGSEDDFAKLMTQKAHALGMSRTTYVNASGLPDDDQITTARDQALLGRAIQDRFPRYYKYFSLPAFVYHGVAIRNHDHLLGQVEGVDGIKTGFTRASGFNLVTSVHRDGRYVVAVVLGGRSGFQRDAHMRELISAHIKEASLQRTAPIIAEQAAPREEPQPATLPKPAMVSRADATPTATVNQRVAAGSNDPIQPLLVKTVSYRIAPVQPAPLAPMPALVAAAPAPQPEAQRVVVASADTVPPVTIAAVKSDPIKPEAAKPDVAKTEVPKAEVATMAPASPEPAKAEPAKSEPPAQVRARGGWLIQIGAYPGEDEAKQHLSAAQTKVRDKLAAADPFTERVLKGDKALYRARFAGFDKATADATCKQLKRNDFECITVKN
ncbi:MAG TPA: serine hydrolase [Xanthobacteraceae bacterium]|nr:serine hydrolase [Xanthobacteraceae bacterium]